MTNKHLITAIISVGVLGLIVVIATRGCRDTASPAPDALTQPLDASGPVDAGTGTGATSIVVQLPKDSPLAAQSPKGTMLTDLAQLPPLPTPSASSASTQPAPKIVAAGRFEPAGLQCPEGIKVTWPLSTARKPGSVLWISYYDDQSKTWRDAGGTAIVGPSGRDATGDVYHFTDYALTDNPLPAGEEGRFQLKDGERTYQTAHFLIRYTLIQPKLVESKQNVEEPDYVRDIGRSFESARATYRSWGYRAPEQQFVKLFPIAHGWDYLFGPRKDSGITAPEVEGESAKIGGQLSIGCFAPNDTLLPVETLKFVIAHEYFHRIQMQYYKLVAPDAFIREGTANIMELLVFPNDAQATAKTNVNMSPQKYDSTSLNDLNNEAATFFLYLTDAIGPGFTREIWEQYEKDPADITGWSALEAALKSQDRNDSIAFRFYDFAEEFLVKDPPRNPLYATLRTNVRGNAPITCIVTQALDNKEEQTLDLGSYDDLTSKYFICERAVAGKAKIKLASSDAATVRVYSLKSGKTEPVGQLKGEEELEVDVGRGDKIGLLVTNNRERNASASVKINYEDDLTTPRMLLAADQEQAMDGGVIEVKNQRMMRFIPEVVMPDGTAVRPKKGQPAYSFQGSGGACGTKWYIPWEVDFSTARYIAIVPLTRDSQKMQVDLVAPDGKVVESIKFTVVNKIEITPGASQEAENRADIKARLAKEPPDEVAVFSAMEIVEDHIRNWDDAKARAALDEFAADFGEQVEYLDTVARFAEFQGDSERAMSAIQKMIDVAPPGWPWGEHNYRDLARYAMVYRNDPVAARAYWAKADAIPRRAGMPESPWPYLP